MIDHRTMRLIGKLRGIGHFEVQAALVEYLLDALADEPEPEEPWTPKVGDTVYLVDGISDDRYEVARIANGRCHLKRDGVQQYGWFDFASLAPAKTKADPGPTADDMLDWLEREGREAIRNRNGKWAVRDCDDIDDIIVMRMPTIRDAIRAAMEGRP